MESIKLEKSILSFFDAEACFPKTSLAFKDFRLTYI